VGNIHAFFASVSNCVIAHVKHVLFTVNSNRRGGELGVTFQSSGGLCILQTNHKGFFFFYFL
jgi:hypothetical protein